MHASFRCKHTSISRHVQIWQFLIDYTAMHIQCVQLAFSNVANSHRNASGVHQREIGKKNHLHPAFSTRWVIAHNSANPAQRTGRYQTQAQ